MGSGVGVALFTLGAAVLVGATYGATYIDKRNFEKLDSAMLNKLESSEVVLKLKPSESFSYISPFSGQPVAAIVDAVSYERVTNPSGVTIKNCLDVRTTSAGLNLKVPEIRRKICFENNN